MNVFDQNERFENERKEYGRNMRKRKVFLETNGCLSRALDLKRIKEYFLKNNCEIVLSPEKADNIIFLGCASVKAEEEWSLKRISSLSKYEKEVIVGGCVKDISKREFPASLKSSAISTKNIEDIDSFFPEFKTKFSSIADANDGIPRNLKHYVNKNLIDLREFRLCFLKRFVQYYYTRIQKNFVIRIGNGCEQEHCSFCSIWKAIGLYRSKPMEVCLDELKIATKKNKKRINLVADNLGAYGIDIGKTLPDLLLAMIQQNSEVVFLLEELSPKWFIKYKNDMLRLIREGKIYSLHMPLQSGSERILTLMNRRYAAKEIREVMAQIKGLNPKLKLYTDIIVGFPTETEEDFDQTLEVIKDIGFDSIAYFEYEHRNDALAFKQIDKNIVKNRLNKLTSFLWKNNIGGGPF